MPRVDDDFDTLRPGDPTWYCTRCGLACEIVRVDDVGFDHDTGKRPEHYHYRCPRQPRNGWQALWRGNHTELCGPGKLAWG